MIGDIYGDFKVNKYTEERNNGRSVICESECIICGTKKYTTEYELKRSNFKHSILNCENAVIKEEIGKMYGDYIVERYVGKKSNCLVYELKCNRCGRKRDRYIKDVRKGIGINHKNCVRNLPNDSSTKRLRNIWSHMVDRCVNENCEKYNSYGGRGIKCNYDLFIDFYDDFYNSYIEHVKKYGIKDTTIDRIDVNGDYTRNNMRWETWETQLQNKRKTIVEATNGSITYIGSVMEVSKKIPCDKSCIYDCLNDKIKLIKGFTVTEKPLTTIPQGSRDKA